MKQVLVFVLLTVAAAPVFAAKTTCTGQIASQVISTSLDVPAGATCQLNWVEVSAPVTVEGTLISISSKFDSNVTVTGTGASIQIVNGFGNASALAGSLMITGSAVNSGIFCPEYDYSNNQPFTNVIGGSLSFTGNSGRLYVCQASVAGGVTVNNNTRINTDYSGPQAADLNNITAVGSLSCSGNTSPNGPAITGSGNQAAHMTGQCAGLN
jgi:hypothetical protein